MPAFSLITALFVALFGLAFGSFLNVCIARLPRRQSIVSPGSRCPSCGAAIRPWDNIPLLSWLILRGRCRSCRRRILWRYPAVELATAALFLLCYLHFGIGVHGVGMALLCFLLLGLAVMDAETFTLPDLFTLPGIFLGIIHAAALPAVGGEGHLLNLASSALSACIAALAIVLIRQAWFLLRRVEGMGLGDAKLLALIAAWLGPPLTLLTFFLAVVSAALVGILWIVLAQLLARSGRRALASRLPFGAFLCAAALYSIFAGEPLIHWYLQFFR
jgi:leader peptidase (prepilin peptidase)/N-methyltransferase